ncbi:MAG: SAM-dependent methyltransferase [Bryobacteraceae bacterium]
MTTSMTTQTIETQTPEQFAEQLLHSASAMLDVVCIYLGDQLGYYEVLAQDGPLTSTQLAARTGTQERYVREWMEHQAVAGILDVEEGGARRRFTLPPYRAEVLANRDSLNYMAPIAQIALGVVLPVDKVLQAFRNGGGVCYHEYGATGREGQGRMNRAAFLQLLGPVWIPAMADVHERLATAREARVADFGCGVGWSSIGVALSYPSVAVDGFDSDQPSIERAKENAAEYGVSDRVRFHTRDAGDAVLHGSYDLVLALECVHDMSDPVAALRTMRRLMRDGGAVLVVDERVGDQFDPNAGVTEKLMYGFSILHCLPAGMAEQPSAGTGTVMRTSTFQKYAEEAGFRDVEVLPIDNPLFRFYRLRV